MLISRLGEKKFHLLREEICKYSEKFNKMRKLPLLLQSVQIMGLCGLISVKDFYSIPYTFRY